MDRKKKTAPKKKSREDVLNSVARMLSDRIKLQLENNIDANAMSKLARVQVIQMACANAIEEVQLLSREELVEKMADEIEDELSSALGSVRANAEKEGEVDDYMAEEALDEALSRVKGWF